MTAHKVKREREKKRKKKSKKREKREKERKKRKKKKDKERHCGKMTTRTCVYCKKSVKERKKELRSK